MLIRSRNRRDRQLPHLGQVGRFSHSVHTTKGDDKRPSLALGLHHISEDIHPPLWLQDLHQRVLQGLLYRRGHSCKRTFVTLRVRLTSTSTDGTGTRPHNKTRSALNVYSLVNVPITLPSSFLATESQSWADISAATFLAKKQPVVLIPKAI